MSQITVINREQHAGKKWLRPANYSFAAQLAVVPLVASELGKAAASMPIAFVRKADKFIPVGLLGLEAEKNLFVGPAGEWVGRYIPARLRAYPFLLAQNGDQMSLCIDEASGLLTDDPKGMPLYDEEGNPSQSIKEQFAFLVEYEENRSLTENACASLEKHGCIQSWPITINTGNGEHVIQDLHCINENALNALPDEAFLELRRSGALVIASCQLVSMQQLALLGDLAGAHAKVAMMEKQRAELQAAQAAQGGSLNFSGIR